MTFTDHFEIAGDTLAPQPWMQLRQVATVAAPGTAKSYGTSGGGKKDDVLQTITVMWKNNSPITQQVYGLVTQGGSSVALQCRSRGYLKMSHGYSLDGSEPSLTEVSRFGGGADAGMGGVLAIGSGFAIHEVRQHSSTMPFMPHLTGWFTLPAGASVTATVEVRFVSDYWEPTKIDGGSSNTESSILSGELRLDLFAVPRIATPTPRPVPTIVGHASATSVTKDVTVTKPAGVAVGDTLIAVVATTGGSSKNITAPAGWSTLHAVSDGFFALGGTHMKIFTKTAGTEPATYTFNNTFLVDEIVHLVVVRNAAPLFADIETSGWAVASNRKKWAKNGDLHVVPSIARSGQLLLAVSFADLADKPLDGVPGPVQVNWTAPTGMTELIETHGKTASMSMSYQALPGNPTGDRSYTSVPRAYFSSYALTAAILIPGLQQFAREGDEDIWDSPNR